MSKIIQIGEHNFELPALPTKGSEILFSKEKKANQFWRRQTDFPQYFFDYNPFTELYSQYTRYNDRNILVSLSEDESEELLRLRERELLRRWTGVWFMNNGEPVWLTPGHYFALQWGQIFGYTNPDTNLPYGEFRMFHRDYFYFLEHCKKQPNVIGGFIAKPKKTGITQMTALELLDEATKWKEKNFGFMSENYDKCKKTNFKFFRHAYDNLPWILRPELGRDLQDEMVFSKVRTKQTGTKNSQLKGMMNTDGFNTAIYAKPTVATAFDSDKFFRAWCDEFPKYEDPYPAEVFAKSSQGVKEGIARVIGKLWITSYFPEDDSKSFLEAQKIYFDSKLKTIKEETGRTKSEMLSYFIPVDVSTTGNIDKYGVGDVEKVRTQIYIDRKQLENDSKALQAYKRQYPLQEDDALGVGSGAGSTFNNLRLGAKLRKVEEQDRHGAPNYIDGNLKWTGERLYSEVKFVPLSPEEKEANIKAPFRIYFSDYLTQYEYNIPLRNYDRVKLRPHNAWAVGGIDPTDYVQAKDIATASKNAAWIFNLPDIGVNTYYGKCVTDRPVCRYFYRHNSPKDTYEDMVKMILYFGCYVRIEANKPWLITKLKEDGLEEFILVIDKDKVVSIYNPNIHTSLPFATKEVIENYCRSIDNYLSEPDTANQPDMLEWTEDIDTLGQLMSFDPLATQKFDLVVAYGNARLAVDGFSAIQKRLKDKNSIYNPESIQNAYNKLVNSGF